MKKDKGKTMDFVKKILLMKDDVNGRHEQIRFLTLRAGID